MALNYLIADRVRAEIVAITEQVRSTLDQVEGEAAASLAAWPESARAAYETHRANWSDAAARMPSALCRAEDALAEISGGYFRAPGI